MVGNKNVITFKDAVNTQTMKNSDNLLLYAGFVHKRKSLMFAESRVTNIFFDIGTDHYGHNINAV